MRIETALAHRDRATLSISDAYSMAKICHMPDDALSFRIREIVKTLDKCPEWVRAYVRGVSDTLRDALYRYDLEYCSILPIGTIVSHVSTSPRYYQKCGISPSELATTLRRGGHFWKDTDRPFYLSEE